MRARAFARRVGSGFRCIVGGGGGKKRMLGRRRTRQSIGGYDKEGKSLSNGVALATQCLSGRHTFETRTPVSLSPFLSLFLSHSHSFSLNSSSLFLPLPSCTTLSLSLSRRPWYRPDARSSVFLAPSFLVLSLCAHLQDDVEARRPCPAPSRRAWSGTNRSAASGNDGAPIGTRRRRIDADERRF